MDELRWKEDVVARGANDAVVEATAVVREDFELPAGGGDTRENMWPTPFGVLSSAAAVGPQASGMWGVELEAR